MKKIIRLNDRIWFGKYKGSRIIDIIKMDKSHILKLNEIHNFELDKKIYEMMYGSKRSTKYSDNPLDVNNYHTINLNTVEYFNILNDPNENKFKFVIERNLFNSHYSIINFVFKFIFQKMDQKLNLNPDINYNLIIESIRNYNTNEDIICTMSKTENGGSLFQMEIFSNLE